MANENLNTNKVALSDGTVLIDLTGDTVDKEHLLKGTTAHDKSGALITGENTYDSDTSEDTAAASEVLEGKTFHARKAAITGTMKNRGSVKGTIDEVAGKYTIQSGYHDGTGAVGINETDQAKLIPANIREGITILKVTGTMSGSENEKKQAKEITPKLTEQVVLPDDGYTCFSQVTVAAIPIVYSPNSAGGRTVTIG